MEEQVNGLINYDKATAWLEIQGTAKAQCAFEREGVKASYNYEHATKWLEVQGKRIYGQQFALDPIDLPLIRKLLCYFLKDQVTAKLHDINLNKGILLTGPVGCGKTSLMNLMRLYQPVEHRFIIKSCRDISFEFIKEGYDTIHKYSALRFKNFEPVVYCFDDLGAENNLTFYGNECNIMAEILLSRYEQFVSRQLLTHVTTNLSASEIEKEYSNRVRSRMREQFNLIAFGKSSLDKRK